MIVRLYTLPLLLLLSLALSGAALAQPVKKTKSTEDLDILREKAVLLKTEKDLLAKAGENNLFTNVNKLAYYQDKKALERILKLEEKGEDISELHVALSKYIEKFGIENFRRDVGLLWLMGRVKQVLKDTTSAVYFYEMAKVHNYGTPAPKLTYDSLTAATNSEWLPIDKYYELLEVRKKIDPLIPPKKVLESMGSSINSSDPDYAPFMHPTDSVMIFTSRRNELARKSEDFIDPFARSNEDIYYAEINFMTGDWNTAEKLSDTINSKFNEGSACLSPDGMTLYFTRCGAKPSYGDCDLYRAEYFNGNWINVRNLGANVNSSYWDSQPNISADGNILFFASNRKGGFGGTDIFFTQKDENGKWSKAQNLGPSVNTPRHEVTPFYHRINQTLFFSSTGHLKNFGGYDIFKARWIGNDWEQPRNVGPLVNTRGNEYYFSINGKGTTIFYANSKDPDKDHARQNFDLYSFPMPMEARPDAIAELKGVLVDSVSGYPLQGTVMILDLDNNVEIAPKEINSKGFFKFDLINNNRYRIYVLGDNFLTVKNDILVTGDTSFTVLTQSFEQNKPIVFESLEFGSNSAKLRNMVQPKLDYIVRFLENYPMFKLQVEGHTDSDGKDANNLKLSIERARRISEYITRKGNFTMDRVTYTGYGETKPIVPNDTEENKSKNRRVEFKLIMDDDFDGDKWLPTEDELFFDKELEITDDEKPFDEGWNDEEREAWEEELDLDDDIDLDAELEEDILKDVGKEKPKPEQKKTETNSPKSPSKKQKKPVKESG